MIALYEMKVPFNDGCSWTSKMAAMAVILNLVSDRFSHNPLPSDRAFMRGLGESPFYDVIFSSSSGTSDINQFAKFLPFVHVDFRSFS